MILLFTDFGFSGPYVGEMHAVLAEAAPRAARVDLMHDAPAFRPLASGLLLEALSYGFAPRSVVVAVVDPGVGTDRRALVAHVGENWFVGPDNGLLAPLLTAPGARAWTIPVPSGASASFHGRDVFAPAAARLSMGGMPRGARPVEHWVEGGGPAERAQVIYIDGYGNVITGLRADDLAEDQAIRIGGQSIGHRRVFGEAVPGELFWYRNSMGLLEVAANGASAAERLEVTLGSPVEEAP